MIHEDNVLKYTDKNYAASGRGGQANADRADKGGRGGWGNAANGRQPVRGYFNYLFILENSSQGSIKTCILLYIADENKALFK